MNIDQSLTNLEVNNKKVKVLLSIPSLNVGGAERVITQLAVNLRKDKFDLRICSFCDEGVFRETLIRESIPIYYLGKTRSGDFRTWIRFLKVLSEFKPDIVHSFLVSAGFWTSLPAYMMRIPRVIYGIRDASDHIPWWVNLMERFFILPFVHSLTFVSQNSEQSFRKRRKRFTNSTYIIRNGVDLCKYQLKSKQKRGSIIIGVVGRLCEEKGLDSVFQAFKIVADNCQNVQLWVIGDGPLLNELKIMTKSLGIENLVIFLGQVSSVHEILNDIDIFVSGSLTEGIPNAHLEAMAAGKAIIATSVGGVPEILDDSCSILVPPSNPDVIAENIVRLIENPSLIQLYGLQARKKAERNFSLEEMILKYEALYLLKE